jgi:protein TonB
MLAAAISAALHAVVWTLWQTVERAPDQPPPPLLIEATLVTPPHPVEPQPPAPPKPPEPLPPKPEPKPPEKPKPVPKPKPVAKPDPAPKPEAASEQAPAAPAVTQAAPAPVPPTAPPTPVIYNDVSLNNPKTRYPPVALQRGWEGTVLLLVQVLSSGTAGEITVQKSSGHELMDESAMEQVRQWRFTPATRHGRPIESSVLIPVDFKINKR